MVDFIVRPARIGEGLAIHEAHMRSIREVCVKDHGVDEIRGWGNRPFGSRWTEAIQKHNVWVVECDGKIFGHAYLKIFEEGGQNHAHVHGLYLTPEALGRGIGLKLGNMMLDTARNRCVKVVTLESTLTAHAFYKHLGFRDTDGVQSMEVGGYPVRYFPMEIQLD